MKSTLHESIMSIVDYVDNPNYLSQEALLLDLVEDGLPIGTGYKFSLRFGAHPDDVDYLNICLDSVGCLDSERL